jgi:hypothetical protein
MAILMALLASPVAAQVTGPANVFVVDTIINPDEVNANFSAIYQNALNRTGGTMTGTLNSQSVLPVASNTYDLGSASLPFQSTYLRTSAVLVQTGGNYTVTWANPGANRAISIADPGGTDVFTFNAATQTLTNKTLTAPTLTGIASVTADAGTGLALRIGARVSDELGSLYFTNNANSVVQGTLSTTGTSVQLLAPGASGLLLQTSHATGGFFVQTNGSNTRLSIASAGTVTLTPGPLLVSGDPNDKVVSTVENTSTGTSAAAESRWFNSSGAGLSIGHTSTGFTPTGGFLADQGYVYDDRVGGVMLYTAHASGDIRFHTGAQATARVTIDQDGVVTGSNRIESFALQPGFLAYNSADDTPATGATIDFDTEVYDNGGNFSSDTFTAPVTGQYLCVVHASVAAGSDTFDQIHLVTSNRTYRTGETAETQGNYLGLAVIADMDASDTAHVTFVFDGGGNGSVAGSSSPHVTFFSCRLLP